MPNRTDGVYAMAAGTREQSRGRVSRDATPGRPVSPPSSRLTTTTAPGTQLAMSELRRFGMVIGVRPERLEEYRELHADSHPGVRDLLHAAHMRNFSIYLQRLPDGHHYLFGYYEYDGTDYAADMARLAAEPRNREWLARCGPMQIPLPGEPTWKQMERVYYNP